MVFQECAGRRSSLRYFPRRYNEVASGSDGVPTARRAADMASDLAGWPLAGTVACSALAGAFWGRKKSREIDENSDRQVFARVWFTRMAWLGAGIAAAVLLIPAYFDTRFLLPIWPVLAVAIGASVHSQLFRLPVIPKTLLGLGLAGSLLFAFSSVAREPSFATYWETTRLIDHLVGRYGVSNLVNVGNCAAWNVCKTGLMNELRADPGSCFVLHDLTRATDGRAERLARSRPMPWSCWGVLTFPRTSCSSPRDSIAVIVPWWRKWGKIRIFDGLRFRQLAACPSFRFM